MSVPLLDVNVLLAIGDSGHAHHDAALSWFGRHYKSGWATCPIVENGFVRIFGNPAYRGGPGSVAGAIGVLRNIRSSKGHVFWPDDVSLAESARITGAGRIGHQQLTDLYLLELAAKHRGRFITFDSRIDPGLVAGGAKALEIIPLA